MTTIIGLAGSLRHNSYNAALLRAAAAMLPSGCQLEQASIAEIPLYDADLEQRGMPAAVTTLKNRIAQADGLLLATPEYNNSMPGVFKNAIDWLSRPPQDIAKVFHGRAVAIMGATPGRFGTSAAQTAWLPVLRTLGTRPYFGKLLYVAQAGNVFNDQGELVDEAAKQRLKDFLAGFCAFIDSTTTTE